MNLMSLISQPNGRSIKIQLGAAPFVQAFMSQANLHVITATPREFAAKGPADCFIPGRAG